ncbi:protein translocase subunit yajC [Cuneatibacter caecimuris]|uniref:Protein translocase subunit yajC n=2 Tax=Cuneatibacter caecimuris TaxID=1796618 RepID=A0A4Q7PPL5_9FIRM|nr:preprotein translocase subunit YajC [Cuneatibacter caecimuris]RZT02862.1 protein translocase subunit yajC [Cuneatibacter caecimuris]
MSNFLAATAEGGAMGWGFWIIYIVIILGAMYFIAIRPQRKQQKKQNELQNSLSIGDSVLTSGGFYGVIIDITEDTVIVEFGNNKNCRIPMQKSSIMASEKPDTEQSAEK